jgi:hypothetical protein
MSELSSTFSSHWQLSTVPRLLNDGRSTTQLRQKAAGLHPITVASTVATAPLLDPSQRALGIYSWGRRMRLLDRGHDAV